MKKYILFLLIAILSTQLSACGCSAERNVATTPSTKEQVSEAPAITEPVSEEPVSEEPVTEKTTITENKQEQALQTSTDTTVTTEPVSEEASTISEELIVENNWEEYFSIEGDRFDGKLTITTLMYSRCMEYDFFKGCSGEEVAYYFNTEYAKLDNGNVLHGGKHMTWNITEDVHYPGEYTTIDELFEKGFSGSDFANGGEAWRKTLGKSLYEILHDGEAVPSSTTQGSGQKQQTNQQSQKPVQNQTPVQNQQTQQNNSDNEIIWNGKTWDQMTDRERGIYLHGEENVGAERGVKEGQTHGMMH